VYLRPDAKWNVNELDCERLVGLAVAMADPPGQTRLYEPEFQDELCKLVMVQTAGGYLAMTSSDLATLVEAARVKVNWARVKDAKGPFTDRSDTFRVRATGKAGAVTSAIDAVVRVETAQPGAPVGAPGRLVHWREE
jgi:hypothetical protein